MKTNTKKMYALPCPFIGPKLFWIDPNCFEKGPYFNINHKQKIQQWKHYFGSIHNNLYGSKIFFQFQKYKALDSVWLALFSWKHVRLCCSKNTFFLEFSYKTILIDGLLCSQKSRLHYTSGGPNHSHYNSSSY